MIEEETCSRGIRNRLNELNTKAYYLVVALSFMYTRSSGISCALNVAITLTALVAVLPVQEFVKTEVGLNRIRWAKMVLLTVALGFTLAWIWCGGSSRSVAQRTQGLIQEHAEKGLAFPTMS